MAINSVGLNKAGTSMVLPTETETKSILNQITSKQQSLNRLSSDSEMSVEEKEKERQEIREQIAELNRKLRMLQMEKKEEAKEAQKKQEQKITFAEEQVKEISEDKKEEKTTVENNEEQKEIVNVPLQDIQKVLEVGTQVQKERLYQSVSHNKEAAINILEAEIATDELYGTDVSAKKEKLHSLIRQEPFELKVEEQQKQQSVSGKNVSGKIIFREEGM